MKDTCTIKGRIRVEKFDADGHLFDTVEIDNLFLTIGINELWKLVIGSSANVFSNGQAQIGIGDSSTAANAGQTDLQAAVNKTYKAMDATYPPAPSGGAVSFRSTFGSADANYAWNEFVVKQATSAICLDRGVGTFGTKAAGTTWVATVTLTIT